MAGPHVPGSEPIAAAPHGTTMAQLLTPNANQPNDGYMHLGTLRVERAIYDDFKAAQNDLGHGSHEAVDQLYALEHARTPIDVRSTKVGQDEFGAREGRPTISWAPHGALLNTNGSTQSPAMGLVHEEGHATRWLAAPQQYNADSQKYPVGSSERATWTTPEERRNITGLEDRIGKALHEGLRADHHGQGYSSRGPTSIESEGVHRVSERIAHLAREGTSVPPVGLGAAAVVGFDHQKHTGSMVDIGHGEMAQSIGQGRYMIYEVARDLHGVRPPEGIKSTTIDPQGHVQDHVMPGQALGR